MMSTRPTCRAREGRPRTIGAVAIIATALAVSVLGFAPAAGAAAPPQLRSSTIELDFGWTTINTNSTALPFTVRNDGPGTATGLTITDPTDDQFERTATTCGATLASGATCTISVRYAPRDSYQAFATLNVFTSTGSALQVKLTGRPDAPQFALKVTPTAFDFGPVATSTNSVVQTSTITNTAGASRTFSTTTSLPAGPFSASATTCTNPTTLAPGASCTVSWRFSPTTTGEQSASGTLVVDVNGGASRTYPVGLTGRGGSGGYPLRVTNTRLDFGNVAVNTVSDPQVVTFTNVSSGVVTGSYGGGAMPDFNVTGCSAPFDLDPGESCNFSYRAQPTSNGFQSNTADVNLVLAGQPEKVVRIEAIAVGTGTAPRLHLRQPSVKLGPTPNGVPSAPQVITLANTGSGPTSDLTIDPDTAASDVDVTTTCGAVLAAGATCTITGVWTPTTLDQSAYVYIDWGSEGIVASFSGDQAPSVHAAFVIAANADFLNKGDDEIADLAQRVSALDGQTLSRRGYVTELANSTEWVSAVIDAMYRDTLGREGDPGGVTFWTNRILSGRNTVAQVAAEFYASSEYYNGIGGGTDTTWVTDLYLKLLERSPDPGGLSYWVGQTASKGRVSVAGRMFESPESRRARVTNLYSKLLLRTPDASGLAYWSGRILTTGDIALAIELASSSEYLRLAQFGNKN